MTYGGLWEGIGGFALAAIWAGIIPVWSNEIDPFCCKVLRKNFTHKIIEDDIKYIGKRNLESVDIICGGFPCQGFSKAGKGLGINDPRYGWPEHFRIIEELSPYGVLIENVPDIDRYMVLDKAIDDLESISYEVMPPMEVEASCKGAFHRRNRVWIVAIKKNSQHPDTHSIGSYKKKVYEYGRTEQRGTELQHQQISLPGPLVSESIRKGTNSRVFRDIDGIPDRVDRLKSLGNAIVPQIAYQLMRSFFTPNPL